jgi:hypothetical protein
LSSGGPKGSRQDTPGHATETVRDREAPGSNPGPPTIFVFKIRCSRAAPESDGAQPGHNFVGNYRNVAVRS